MPVSDADVDHIRRAFVEFNQRYDTLRGDGLERYHAEFYAPDAVIEHVDGFPLPGRFEGLDGYREWFAESYGSYREVSWRIEEVQAAGERVVALVRVSGKPADSPVELEVALGITYEMRDGRIEYVRVYVGHERALDAASSDG